MWPESSRLRLFWVTPKYPLGVSDGARHATRTLMRHLSERGASVELVCLSAEGETDRLEEARRVLGVKECRIIARKPFGVWPLPSFQIPLTFKTFAEPEVRRSLQMHVSRFCSSLSESDIGYVLFDGLHTLAALDGGIKRLASRCRGVIYRAHNVETVLWEQWASRTRLPGWRWFLRRQAGLIGQFEQAVSRQVTLIAPVSDEDAKRFKAWAPETAVCVTRIGMEFPKHDNVEPVHKAAQVSLVFLGRLDWHPNRAGLQWFLKNVWSQVASHRKDISLKIAGNGDGRWLEKYRGLPRLDLLGRVEDVQPLYGFSALAIAPLFQGSGMRVKLVEAARYKRGAISTELGAEGTGLVPGTSYLRAESREEWIHALSQLTLSQCHRLGMNAFDETRERFNPEAAADQLLASLVPARVAV